MATDSWYIRELTADVPEDEWEAAVKDEDWDEEMIEVGGEEDEEAESEEDCDYSEESGEEDESNSDDGGSEGDMASDDDTGDTCGEPAAE